MSKNTWQSLWDKFWKDKHGKVVIWQSPNRPLFIWLVSVVVMRFIRHGLIHQVLDVAAFSSLFVWAYLEIRWGVNYFRRGLGFTVLLAIILAKAN